MRQSLDPMAASWAQPDWEGGRLLTVKSPQQVGGAGGLAAVRGPSQARPGAPTELAA